MFSMALVNKAITDPLWRRHTALGRKVASKIRVHLCRQCSRTYLDHRIINGIPFHEDPRFDFRKHYGGLCRCCGQANKAKYYPEMCLSSEDVNKHCLDER